MHCDVGPNNLLLRTDGLEVGDAVPDWPEQEWVKRPALLADWGLGLKTDGLSSKNRGGYGWVTVRKQHDSLCEYANYFL